MKSNLPNFKRLIAPNPSMFTGDGTNTYIFGQSEKIVIDPGPVISSHLRAIKAELPSNALSAILVTHSHLDHSPLARVLSNETGAPIYAFGPSSAGRSLVMQKLVGNSELGGGEGSDPDFAPGIFIHDGETLNLGGFEINVHHTPGHFGNHCCFGIQDELFCGDHVMAWSSTLVSPPDGDLTDFMASCEKLLRFSYKTYFPGHGDAITEPVARLEWLIGHRKARERSILDQLAQKPVTIAEITRLTYQDVPPHVWPAAQRNVLAHLIDLWQKDCIIFDGKLTAETKFSLL